MKRVTWQPYHAQLLGQTFIDEPIDCICAAIEAGELELWDFSDRTVAILEPRGDALYVWAIAGQSLRVHALELIAEARRRGLAGIEFRTMLPGIPRILAPWHPRIMRRIGEGAEYRVELAA